MGFNTAFSRLPEDDFLFIMKNGKRINVLLGYDFKSLIYSSFKFLKETLPDLIKNCNFEKLVLEMFMDRGVNVFTCDIDSIDYNEMLYFIFWVMDEMEAIAKMENTHLVSETDMDLISAGIQEMQQFGELNTIDSLAGGDVLKWEQVKLLPYHVVFDKQFKSIVEQRISKKYSKNMSDKSKAKKH